MVSVLALFADPLFVIALAVLIFIVRVVFLAKHLKAAARHPTFADLRALEEAKKALDAHKDSLDDAKETLSSNIEGARDILRHYRRPLDRARAEKRKAIEKPMATLRQYRKPFEKAQKGRRDALVRARDQKEFREAKALSERYRSPRPPRKKVAEEASKDI